MVIYSLMQNIVLNWTRTFSCTQPAETASSLAKMTLHFFLVRIFLINTFI